MKAVLSVLGAKKRTFSGKSVLVSGNPTAAVLTKGTGSNAATMNITVAGDTFGGEIDGLAVVGVRNVSAAKETRKSDYAAFAGTYCVALHATNAVGSGAAFANGYCGLSVKVLAKGTAKLTGVMGDGVKVSASGLPVMLSSDSTAACIPVVAPMYNGKYGGVGFLLWIGSDGNVEVSSISQWDASVSSTAKFIASLAVDATGKLSAPAAGAYRFSVAAEDVPENVNGLNVLTDLLPTSEPFTLKSSRFAATKANAAKVKISRAASTGLLSGSFSVSTQNASKTKKTTAKVSGVFVGKAAYGTALIKKNGTAAVTVVAE